MEYNWNSPNSSEADTPPIPTGGERNIAGSHPQVPGTGGGMPGMNPQMVSAMFNWWSQAGMPGLGGSPVGTPGMGGAPVGMPGMGGTMYGAPGVGVAPSGGVWAGAPTQHRAPSPRTPRESVYRPYIDLLADDSPSSVPETQLPGSVGFDSFSFDQLGLDLGLSPIRETPAQAEPPSRPRSRPEGRARSGGRGNKGKAPSTSSFTATEEEDEDEADGRRRTIWSVYENAALAGCWIGVVEDPYHGANQYVDRLWFRICEAYLVAKPTGAKVRTPEQLRKQWTRLRPKLSRFANLYNNHMRMASSGMSEDDVKNRAMADFPDRQLGFREFDQWEAFLVVKDSQKFCAGVEQNWKRTRINASGEYSSSAGSHDLPDPQEVAPLPRTDSRRRRRPMGQQAAQRMARGGGSTSTDVQSGDPPEQTPAVARASMVKTLTQTMHTWFTTTNPTYKKMCKEVIDDLRKQLGYPPIDDDGVEIASEDVGGGSGTGDGDEDDEE